MQKLSRINFRLVSAIFSQKNANLYKGNKMNFATAVEQTKFESRTENGMKALQSSTNHFVDLFYKIGASRGQNIVPDFERAYQQDATLATRIALWARDVRGGAGERQLFRDILVHLENLHPEMLDKVLPHVPVFGRWDDLLVFQTSEFKALAYTLIGNALREGNGLCAKWMPRKGAIAVELRRFYGMSPKQYRTSLVALTNVVEQKMCANDWNNINFSHVPSLAAARYQKAFMRRAKEAYSKYKEALVTGEAKINAAAVYPHDVVRSINNGDAQVALAQWEALPNYMTDAAVLPMVDVSGSMHCPVGGNCNLTCMDVSVALGLYCSDKNRGAFKDLFLTFSQNCKLEKLSGDLLNKHTQLVSSEWGMNTDLHAAFDAVLKVAVDNKVSEEEMPKYLLILSDMQFDQCSEYDDSAMEMIERKYTAAGYSIPKIVFWNLSSRNNAPVEFNRQGVAMISGFSPAIMKSILAAKEFTPESIMLDTVNQPRYSVV